MGLRTDRSNMHQSIDPTERSTKGGPSTAMQKNNIDFYLNKPMLNTISPSLHRSGNISNSMIENMLAVEKP